MDISPWQQAMASCSGAVLTSLLMTPFDVIKVRLQAQARIATVERCVVCFNGVMDHFLVCPTPKYCPLPQQTFNSTLDALTKIVRYEGLPALWGGLTPALVMSVPATVIYMTLYDRLKLVYGFKPGENNVFSPMFAGVSARAFAVGCISPIEMIRVKLQSRNEYKYRELFKVVRTGVKQGGVMSLWQGLGPTLYRDVPFSALYWFGYEFLRSRYEKPTFYHMFLSGAISGTVAGVLTLPFDVLKTHRQIELGESSFDPKRRFPSTFSLLLKLQKEKGIQGLFAGITARIAKVAPACAIMITSYEYGKAFFRQQNQKALTKQLDEK